MMRVRVEIVPFGEEAHAHVVESILIGQLEKRDNDPGGWRTYGVWEGDTVEDARASEPLACFDHKRSDGALLCATVAMETLERFRK